MLQGARTVPGLPAPRVTPETLSLRFPFLTGDTGLSEVLISAAGRQLGSLWGHLWLSRWEGGGFWGQGYPVNTRTTPHTSTKGPDCHTTFGH